MDAQGMVLPGTLPHAPGGPLDLLHVHAMLTEKPPVGYTPARTLDAKFL